MPDYTPTQQRMLKVLSDGERHTKVELHACLGDDLGSENNVSAQLWLLRKKLLTIGQTVVCEHYFRRYYYRHVRLLASVSKG